MKRIPFTILLATVLAVSAPATSADESSPRQMIEEGVQRILDAVGLVLEQFPRYAAPEMLDNGDIIIRRKDPPRRDRRGDGRTAPKQERTGAGASAA